MAKLAQLKPVGTIERRITGVASGSTATLYTEAIPAGLHWFVKQVAVRDDTTTGAECELFIDRWGVETALERLGPVAANEFYGEEIETWLHSNERLRFDWSGLTSGDKLECHVTGILYAEVGDAGE